jgi:hypothetical protein
LVCPYSFTELALLASAHLIHCLLKDILHLLVRCFCLTARLRVIRSGNPVINSNVHKSFLECPINEVWPSITDDYSWDSIPWEDDFMKHPLRVYSVDGSTRKSFYPLGDIVDCYQDVLATFRVRDGPMKSIPHTPKMSIWRFEVNGIASITLIFPCF